MFKQIQKFIALNLLIFLITGCAGHKMLKSPSLYDRLGGKMAIDAVVEDFVGRLATDSRIKNEKVKARLASISVPNLKMHLANLICVGAGGPCKYTGRDMKSSHAELAITSAEFGFVVDDLLATLNKFNVPEKEKGEILGLLGPMKKDIVEVH
ncbi:MAG: group 1 truncated hemoglobin [Nitrospirota bacterium]